MKSAALKRPYRQTARAAAAEATRERILDAFIDRMRESWFDEIRLEEVARDAQVTVQTVIRRFGGKDGLLEAMHERSDREIRMRRAVRPGDLQGAVRVLTEDYEAIGGLILRLLAQEDRYPAVKRLTDVGRAAHRGWIREVFAPWLQALPAAEAERRLDGLVAAMDLYVWKLVRRDMRRPIAEYQALVRRLVLAVLDAGTADPSQLTTGE
ncbi:MAG TPA: TetR/AcrR family transcriptional regulator [Phenylobacterium sp.]|uniref:TetR/AcrR family transcriptional regulator n=1 Tax=Phenylobacterium sp. TaxID=1871053 RepID=UPI002BFE4361|nr:TetR/AcrR family transcriptional regulator [Phenylobacterium sp.]HSV04803.1 TetR/AcrR family transcriptional regulator [Phenylobacterium sp.]